MAGHRNAFESNSDVGNRTDPCVMWAFTTADNPAFQNMPSALPADVATA